MEDVHLVPANGSYFDSEISSHFLLSLKLVACFFLISGSNIFLWRITEALLLLRLHNIVIRLYTIFVAFGKWLKPWSPRLYSGSDSVTS